MHCPPPFSRPGAPCRGRERGAAKAARRVHRSAAVTVQQKHVAPGQCAVQSLEDLIDIRGMLVNQTPGGASARTEGTRPGSARRSSP